MNKIIATLAAVAAVAFAGAASANPLAGYYVQGTLGGNYQANRQDGEAFSASVGKDFGLVRSEVEYLGTRGNDSSTLGGTSTNLVNVNAFIQPITVLGGKPFVGAGVGYGELFRKGVVGGDRNDFVLNGTVGYSHPITTKIAAVVQYRYFLANDDQFRSSATSTSNYKASTVSVGVRYTF